MRQQLIDKGIVKVPTKSMTYLPIETPSVQEPDSLVYRIEGKVRPIKNSRRCINGKSVMSERAHLWLASAKNQLAAQHQGEVLESQYDLEAIIFYSTLTYWLDSDNALSSITDAMKGIVVYDDAPKYLRRVSCEPRESTVDGAEVRLSRVKRFYE
jgi:hydrogenase maturation factor HypF (carbamoyltransferase family)